MTNHFRLRRGRLDDAQKVALKMDFRRGVSKRQLSREYSVDIKVVRRILKADLTRSPEGLSKISPTQKKIAIRRKKVQAIIAKKDSRGVPKYNSARKIRAQLIKQGIVASKRTILDDLKASGCRYMSRPVAPALSTEQKEKRVQFCNRWKGKNTTRIVFSDEKIFDTNERDGKVWVIAGETPVRRSKCRWAPSCHVWGAVGVGWRRLEIFPSGAKITAGTYIQTLSRVRLPRGCIFQQDGARPHTARSTLAYLESRNIDLLRGWPANSPDLSPIENVWSMVQSRVNDKIVSSRNALVKEVKKAWNAIPQAVIDRTVLSFGKRAQKCYDMGGAPVKKW